MAMAWVWTFLVAISVIYGLLSGSIENVSAAAMEGAGSAITLCISICGIICIWSGIMEVLKRCGFTEKLSAMLTPLLHLLFPKNKHNKAALEYISANMSANMLGLGNAATPLGIKAASAMCNGSSTAGDDLCMLIVINTASIQLIPATVAAVRSAAGCETPFDILPAVWITSLASVTAGIIAAKVLSKLWRN